MTLYLFLSEKALYMMMINSIGEIFRKLLILKTSNIVSDGLGPLQHLAPHNLQRLNLIELILTRKTIETN